MSKLTHEETLKNNYAVINSDDNPSLALLNSDISAVEFAVFSAEELKDLTPLILQLKKGNPALLINDRAVELLIKRLSGEVVTGSGRPISFDVYRRDSYIYWGIFELRKKGLAIKGSSVIKKSACVILSQYFTGLAPDSIYKIWDQKKKDEEIKKLTEWWPENLFEGMYRPHFEHCSPEIIADFFYSAYREDLDSFYDRHSDRKLIFKGGLNDF